MEIYNSTTQPPPSPSTAVRICLYLFVSGYICFFLSFSTTAQFIVGGFLLSCIIAWVLFIFSLWLGARLGWCSKSTFEKFSSICAESPKSKTEFESFKASLEKPDKSQGKPELQQTYQSNLLAAPLKSNMTWLKGPKVDQLPNLFSTPKTVGTLEELLITP